MAKRDSKDNIEYIKDAQQTGEQTVKKAENFWYWNHEELVKTMSKMMHIGSMGWSKYRLSAYGSKKTRVCVQ